GPFDLASEITRTALNDLSRTLPEQGKPLARGCRKPHTLSRQCSTGIWPCRPYQAVLFFRQDARARREDPASLRINRPSDSFEAARGVRRCLAHDSEALHPVANPQ